MFVLKYTFTKNILYLNTFQVRSRRQRHQSNDTQYEADLQHFGGPLDSLLVYRALR